MTAEEYAVIPPPGSTSRWLFIRTLGDREPKQKQATVHLPGEQQLPRRTVRNDTGDQGSTDPWRANCALKLAKTPR